MRPHRRQPTRLPRPWDSPGKNTGVGCHFLLQCMKVKLLSRVWLLATQWTAAYQAPPSMRFSRQEYWSGELFQICANDFLAITLNYKVFKSSSPASPSNTQICSLILLNFCLASAWIQPLSSLFLLCSSLNAHFVSGHLCLFICWTTVFLPQVTSHCGLTKWI